MEVIELIEEMCDICEKLRQTGHRIRFVPTMGALHDGHASLIRRANSDKNDNNYIKNSHSSSSTCHLSLACSNGHGNLQNTSSQSASSELADNFQMRISDSSTAALFTSKEKNIDYCQKDYDADDVLKYKQREKIVVIVSIFVNSNQFNNPNDFANYPKTLESDLEICRNLNVDYVFAPTSIQMYPMRTKKSLNRYSNNALDNYALNHCIIQAPKNKLALDLEGKSRPGHFEGMLTVVCKLFNIIKPHVAYFGEKDYQQLVLIQSMVQDLNLNIKVKAGKTIRDLNLLPLSSRNVRLKEDERKVASIMYKILCDAKNAIESIQLTSPSCGTVDSLNYLDIADSSIDCKYIDTIIFASMLTTLSLNLSDDSLDIIDINYLELRCAKDITKISYVENSDFKGFDCENCCAECQLNSTNNVTPILKARLLTSIVVGEVRLLDNIEVLLNLKKIKQ